VMRERGERREKENRERERERREKVKGWRDRSIHSVKREREYQSRESLVFWRYVYDVINSLPQVWQLLQRQRQQLVQQPGVQPVWILFFKFRTNIYMRRNWSNKRDAQRIPLVWQLLLQQLAQRRLFQPVTTSS
jgi:hypothetical protein